MNSLFEHILVPYNGSPGSEKAFKKAVMLAQMSKAKITILTCLEERTTFGLFKTKTNKNEYANEHKLVTQKHIVLKKYAQKYEVLPTFKIIKNISTSHAILEFADKSDVDLIIFGTRKFVSHYEKMYYPSTIEKVSKNFHGAILILN